MKVGNNLPKSVKSNTEGNDLEDSDPEEYELVDNHGGYVLKYAGDGVISFFPDRINNKKKYYASDTSVQCGKSMTSAVKEEINVILHKIYRYPELFPKIGIDAGVNAIVQFGYDEHSHLLTYWDIA